MEENNNNDHTLPVPDLLAGVLALGLVGAFSLVAWEYTRPAASASQVAAVAEAALPSLGEVDLLAQSAIVYDVAEDRVLYEKDMRTQRPLASITKLPLALAASEVLDREGSVAIPAEALLREGESGLVAGDAWNVGDLIDYTLVVSSNDGAEALSMIAGPLVKQKYPEAPQDEQAVWRMNDMAKKLGLTQTYFLDPSGLDESVTQASAYGSAADIAVLMAYAISEHPEVVAATAKDGELISTDFVGEYEATNTNTLLGEIPGLIAGKTGFTDLAGGNLVIAFDSSIGRPIVTVVLGSTREGRFEDTKKLVEALRASYK